MRGSWMGLGLMAALAGPAVAAELAPANLVEKGALTYGVAATFAPFEFTKDGKLAGFDIDMIGPLSKKLGVDTNADEHGVQGSDPRAARRPPRYHQLGDVHQRQRAARSTSSPI